MELLYVSIFIQFIIYMYVFRLQRATLTLARLYLGRVNLDQDKESIGKLQVMLTPDWAGMVGWVATGLMIINVFTLINTGNWFSAILIVAITYIGIGLIEPFYPLPSYTHCFNHIEKYLKKAIKGAKLEEDKHVHEQLLDFVKEARASLGK